MDKSVAIRVENVKKDFKVYFDKGSSFKERILFRERNRYERREVLKGISFDVKKGEAIGLIGKNGCGKSTMLKLLTKIMYPTSGNVTTQGRISALIELGAGFHPDMSGKENIYTNAAIFGLTKNEIDERLQAIIDFSELGSFIDNPVRTYSSGMYMRLAFAVAINVDADILLIDEILAVGDAAFQAKCFNKLREIKMRGTTIVIVSHSLGQIEQICDRSIWICDGKIRMEGAPRDVHPAYMDYMGKSFQQNVDSVESVSTLDTETSHIEIQEKNDEDVGKSAPYGVEHTDNRWGSGEARIKEISILDKDGKATTTLCSGSRIRIVVGYEILKPIDNPIFGVAFYRSDGFYCYGTNTRIDGIANPGNVSSGKYIFSIDSCPFMPGEYYLDVAISRQEGFDCDYWQRAICFNVYSVKDDVGNVFCWS